MAEAKELTQKRHARGGQRSSLTKMIQSVNQLVEDFKEENRQEVKKFYSKLKEKMETLNKLDEQMLDLVSVTKGGDIGKEVDETGRYKDDLFKAMISSEEALSSKGKEKEKEPVVIQEAIPVPTVKEVRVKLPKLESKTFDGKAYEWQEFWDSFESSIHTNEQLSDVDKFSYLWNMLKGAAKTTIAGFSLTSANYNAVIELLEKRYGNATAIKRAQINELLNLSPVYNENDTERLRTLLDLTETHYRGLVALGIAQETYYCVVVPKILEKIPESVRLNMTRGTGDAYQEGDMQQMIDSFRKELELRERASQFFGKNKGVVTRKQFGKSGGQTIVSVLFSKKSEGRKGNCAFCMENHSHRDCRKVVSVQDHKALFRKYARCFICASKGHLAQNCRSNRSCEHCGGSRHISICAGQDLQARVAEDLSLLNLQFSLKGKLLYLCLGQE